MGLRATLLTIVLFSLAVPGFAQEAPIAAPPARTGQAQAGQEPGGEAPGSEFRSANGRENWTYEYDVSGLKPGTYNIVARAVDSAGNVSYSTPFNMVVDPASDLPTVGIVNPLPLARVGADLNVAGTCVDDDAVDYVELRLDDGEWRRAQGADYWSLYLPTADVPDGLHTLAARGVDSNGLAGPETRRSFHLDRTKPLHAVKAPAFGELVSGRLSVAGTIYDANGLASASYSMDSGATWMPLRYSYDKKANTGAFSLALDTRKLPDGPTVLWLRSVDKVGSEGVAVFLYFVDNTAPELAALSPAEGEPVNGRFELRGKVYDTVGVSSLSWTFGKETGAVELLPGNPYFTLPFEAPAKAGQASVRLVAKDVAGNATTVDVSRRIDPALDLPVATLAFPSPGSVLEGAIRVAGYARDDDGVASIAWRLDGGPETALPTDGAFSFSVDGAASGARTLWVRATDVNGQDGPWLQTPFTYSGAAPALSIDRVADADGERDFSPGASVSTLDGRAALRGSLAAANPIAELSYSINGGAPVALAPPKSPGASGFAVPLPASLPFGVLDVRVDAKDAFGKSGSVRIPVLAVDYSRPRVGPLLDFGLPSEPSAEAPVTVDLSAGRALEGVFVAPFDGEAPRAARLEPATGLAEVAFEGTTVRVSGRAEGSTEPTMVVVETERGHVFYAGPFIFAADGAPPSVIVSSPAFGSWHGGALDLVVEATDGDRVASVEYSTNGTDWAPLAGPGPSYRASIALDGLKGPVRLDVRATDRAGNSARSATAFMADSAAPEPARLLPRDGDEVLGPTLFAVRPGESMESVASLELGRNGSYEPLPAGAVATFVVDVTGAPLTLRVGDKAGNVAEIDLMGGLVVASERPSAPGPLAGLKSNAEAAAGVSGPMAVFSGSDSSGALSWATPLVAPPAGASPDASMFPGYASVPIRASGAASLVATFTGVSPDPKKPVAAWGYSPDAIDTPLALKKAGTTGAWSAALKLPARPDGPASIWVSVRDGAGGDSFAMLSLDYDSTPPTIEIVAPDATGGKASAPGPFILVVRASDARGVASLSYESGKEKGELERLPGYGDAFRAFSFPPKSLSAAVTVRAVDGSGNGSSTTVAVAYDAAADAPTAAFLYPAEGEALPPGDGSGLSTILYAYDDDGLAGVGATVDSVRYDAAGPGPLYSIAVPRLAPGKRIATASATDSGGLSSAKTVTGFAQRGAEPRASIGTVQRGGEKDDPAEGEAFVSGSSLVVDGKTALLATIASPTGLSRLEYSLNGGPWASVQVPKPGPDGLYRARMPLPATAPYGRNSVASRAVDSAGAETLAYASFYRVAPMPGAGAVVSEGAYLLDARITGDDRRAVLAPGQALEALWYGRPVSAVSLEPPKPFAEASFEGRSLRIVATADGGAEPDARPTSLKVETVDGDTFLSSPILLVVDSGPPALALESPVPGSPARGSFVVAGTASDPNGLASLEWSVDGGSTWSPFETPGTAPASAEAGPSAFSGAFSATISPEAADGAVGLLVRAVDASGAASVALSCVAKDEAAPSLFFESPRPVDTVNGTVLVSGYAEDALSVASVEFSADGVGWESLAIAPRGASRAESKRASFSRLVDLGSLPEGGAAMAFRVADAAGNASVVAPLDPSAPAFAVDIEADKPTIQVQIPLADDVMRSDFAVSGMAFDDDGIAELFWRLDGSEWTRVDGSNGFAVPFKLLELSDNEHLFEAYAVDLNGVEGEASSRAFRVSREEPVGRLASPSVDVVNRGVITLRGVASDANGIAAIEVSFDNGATYNAAIGTEEWSYELDTRTVPDGVHSVYARLVDGYGTPGLAAGLLSIDNTPPVVKLDTPDDGWEGAASLSIGGRVSDGMALRGARLVISRLGAPEPETVVEIGSAGVFSRDVDIRELPAGWYNVKAEAYDRAGNAAFDSRNVLVLESRKADYAEITFPAHGERLSGRFSVDGRVVSAEPLGKAAVTLDGRPFAVVDLSKDGWFSLAVGPGDVGDGRLSFRVEAVSASGAAIVSDPRVVEYSEEGPWVDIETLSTGDFVVGRPYLVGSAGWNLPAEPAEGEGTGSAKESAAESRRLAAARRPIRVEISRDNGKTYRDASGAAAFKFRLETQEYPNGALRLVIRATFAGGETAVRKRLVVLDTKAPAIAILKPAENGRYNGTVSIEGTASDGNGLSEVSVALRSGDKASYEVPGFIQGSYVDAHLLGATRFEGGIGLSFFDDKVKLQAAIGQGFDAQPSWDNILGIATADTPAAELSRFGGYIIGAKLLASLAYLPFSYFLGPDWDFFSMSFALGASFTYFSMRDSIADILSPPDDRYMILSGVVGQWEFAKFEFGTTFFKTLSLYVEGGFVFIPSEASTKLEEMIRPNVAFGVRIGLF